MILFSKTWVRAFRGAVGDYDETAQEVHVNDLKWWKDHQEEIEFFFNVLLELGLGHCKEIEEELVLFRSENVLKRILKEYLYSL